MAKEGTRVRCRVDAQGKLFFSVLDLCGDETSSTQADVTPRSGDFIPQDPTYFRKIIVKAKPPRLGPAPQTALSTHGSGVSKVLTPRLKVVAAFNVILFCTCLLAVSCFDCKGVNHEVKHHGGHEREVLECKVFGKICIIDLYRRI